MCIYTYISKDKSKAKKMYNSLIHLIILYICIYIIHLFIWVRLSQAGLKSI